MTKINTVANNGLTIVENYIKTIRGVGYRIDKEN